MSDTQKDKKDGIVRKGALDLSSVFNVFFRNEHHTFIVLKSEKLAAALYTVTNFMSETDPLRARLRSCSLDLVSWATGEHQSDRVGDVQVFSSRALEIGGMLSVAEKAGLISPMNTKILSEEYAALALFAQQHRERIARNDSINVAVEIPQEAKTSHEYLIDRTSGRSSQPALAKRTNIHKRHQSRREVILSLLSKKDKITVKDATNSIQGCSEKTMQRELISMVEDGVLLKEGERRWSVYRKAS